MNINFKTHFPWLGADGKPEPTHFKEQIMNALHPELVSSAFDEFLPDPKPIAAEERIALPKELACGG